MVRYTGRITYEYANTKSDPICKWRTASLDTVVELVSYLPKTEMSKAKFREIMKSCYDGHFFRNAYQLALQLGLYYEDKNVYIPRFDHNINILEAKEYMQKWITRYYVPNPFTKKGFINISPGINLLYGLVDYLNDHPTKPNLATAGAALFGGVMGNIDCVRFVLNDYSNVISVDKDNNMTIVNDSNGEIDVPIARDDKRAFFDHFN